MLTTEDTWPKAPSIFVPLLGPVAGLIFVEPITQIALSGHSFYGRAMYLQAAIYTILSLAVALILFLIQQLLHKRIPKTRNIYHSLLFKRILTAFYIGGCITFLFQNLLAPVVFSGKTYENASSIGQIGLSTGAWLLFSLAAFGLLTGIPKLKRFKGVHFPGFITTLVLIGLTFSCIFLFNRIFPRIDQNLWTFSWPDLFPMDFSKTPVGEDFRLGIYRPAEALFHPGSIPQEHFPINPPFTRVLFMPLLLLEENSAYLVFVFLVFLSDVISTILMSILLRDTILKQLGIKKPELNILMFFLAFLMLGYTLTGYSILWGIERGDTSSIAMLFAVSSLYLMVKKPKRVWLQVILLSISAHLKIYFAIMFLLLIVIHKRKVILPLLAVNTVMFLSLGFHQAGSYFGSFLKENAVVPPDLYNHSGFSFARLLSDGSEIPHLLSNLPINLTALPVLIWLISIVIIIKNFENEMRTLLLFLVSIPMMSVALMKSYDYNLIILGSSFFTLLSILLCRVAVRPKSWNWLPFILVLFLMFFIERSPVNNAQAVLIFSNKYPPILALSLVMLLIIFQKHEKSSVLDQLDG